MCREEIKEMAHQEEILRCKESEVKLERRKLHLERRQLLR